MTAVTRRMFVAVLALAGSAASGQTIYRCGHTYSRVPCPSAKEIVVDGRTTAAQRAEARQVALREKRLGDDMARDRRLAEAAQKPALATSMGPSKVIAAAPTPPKKSAKKKKQKAAQPDDGRDFIAVVPKVKKSPG